MAKKRGVIGAHAARGSVRKVPTGIRGLDEVLQGGVPRGRALVVMGGSGAGKTVLMNEFIYRGITEFGEPGVFVTFEERPEAIAANVAGFGWDYAALIRRGGLAVVDATPLLAGERPLGGAYDFTPLFLRIGAAVKRLRAKRLALDSFDTLAARFPDRAELRDLLGRVCRLAADLGVTTLISAEQQPEAAGGSLAQLAQFVADGAIELTSEAGQQSTLRHLRVRKMRGTGYRSGRVEFAIGGTGIEIFPKLPVDRGVASVSLENRKGFGIARMDALLGGGIPEGYTVLLSGNTGTGKTTFAQHFLAEGVRSGEHGIFVALEEPSGQVRRLARAQGWDFARWEKAGKLSVLDAPMIDLRPDDVLSQVRREAQRIGAKRLVIDSISSLRSATMDGEQVRQFLVQLGDFVKARGMTCIMTYLSGGLFGAGRGQLLGALTTNDERLSSSVDAVILQRYTESAGRVQKLLTVLKLRGVEHDRAIHRYEITRGNVLIAAPPMRRR